MLDLHLIKNNLNAAINSEITTTYNVRLLKSLYNLFCRCLLHFMPRDKYTVFPGDYRDVVTRP
jgi:hypothetical protein